MVDGVTQVVLEGAGALGVLGQAELQVRADSEPWTVVGRLALLLSRELSVPTLATDFVIWPWTPRCERWGHPRP